MPMSTRALLTGCALAVAVLAIVLVASWQTRDARRPEAGPDVHSDWSEGASRPVLGGRGGVHAGRSGRDAGSEQDKEAKGQRLVGRVLDDQGEFVADALVYVADAASVAIETTTKRDGRFSVQLPRLFSRLASPVTLKVQAGNLVALRGLQAVPRHPQARNKPAIIDVGDVLLSTGYPIRVRVTAHESRDDTATLCVSGAPATGGASLRLRVPLGQTTLIPPLPQGDYVLAATALGAARSTHAVFLPWEPALAGETIELFLPAARNVEVRVLNVADKMPVPGARVSLYELVRWSSGWRRGPYVPSIEIPATDEAGRTSIAGLGEAEEIAVIVDAPGFAGLADPSGGGDWIVVPPNAGELTLHLVPRTNLRWPIAPGASGQPADGTSLQLLLPPNLPGSLPERASIRAGHVEIEGVDSDALRRTGIKVLHARSATGLVASLPVPDRGFQGEAVVFTVARTLRVTLAYDDGELVPGVPLRTVVGPHECPGGPRTTDAKGSASFHGLPPAAGVVYAMPRDIELPYPWSGTRLATFDAGQGDRELRCRIARPVHLRIGVRCAWNPRLPDLATFTLNGLPASAERLSDRPGEFAVAWEPVSLTASVRLGVHCPGCVPVVRVLDPGAGESNPVEFDLQSAGEIVVRILSRPSRRPSLRLERWDEDREAWLRGEVDPLLEGRFLRILPGSADVAYVRPLPLGRYRVVDDRASMSSGEIDLTLAAPRAELTLDLRGEGAVSGVVVDSLGQAVSGALVEVLRVTSDQAAVHPALARTQTDDRGRFVLHTNADPQILVVASHPDFGRGSLARGRGVRPGDRDLVIRIGGRAGALLVLDLGTGVSSSHSMPRECRVSLMDREGSALVWSGRVGVKDRQLALHGIEPGAYDVHVDAPPFAPVTIRDVELRESMVDLGTATLDRGGEIAVVMGTATGTEGRLEVIALHVGVPPYERRASGSLPRVAVYGLGTGSFRVQAQVVGRPETRRVVMASLQRDERLSLELPEDR